MYFLRDKENLCASYMIYLLFKMNRRLPVQLHKHLWRKHFDCQICFMLLIATEYSIPLTLGSFSKLI